MSTKKKGKKIPRSSKAPKKAALRGELMELFRKNPNKIFNYKQISSKLGVVNPEGRRLVLDMLNDYVKSNLLEEKERGKFQIHPDQTSAIIGIIDFTKSGSAYVSSDGFKEDIFVRSDDTDFALQGDTVEVSISGSYRGKSEGKVTKVLDRASTQFVGVIQISKNHAFVVPSNPRIHVDFFVDKDTLLQAKNGQKVIVEFVKWTDKKKSPEAKITNVLGDPGVNDVEMHAILVEFGLPFEFPDEVLRAAEKIDVDISQSEIAQRRDFRAVPTFTIDPDDAKDFDDALSIQKLKNGRYEVGVHIADVSHYVLPDSILDKEALKRATSVYLVDRVVPMLPEVLSNFVCSLRPEEEKLCMSAVFEIEESGKVVKEWFGRSVIKSQKRFTYGDAQDIIEGGKSPFSEEMLRLNNWAKQMRKDRMQNGALEFSGMEVKFKLDESGKPIGVYHKVMKEANFLIEEFMLLANKKVAEYIGNVKKGQNAKTFVYRVHDLPDPEKLITLKNFVSNLGYKLRSVKPENASTALNDLMHQVKDKPEEEIVKQMAIRTMSKAIYTTENIGHYGLHFDYYTHFTSPIRRYPDVMVHRLLHQYQQGGTSVSEEEIERQSKHSSSMEKKASDAERSSIKYKQVEYMLDKIGENFYGTISGLTRWGMYVELEDTRVEGMIPLNSMDDDEYRYDEKKNQIIGNRYKEVFSFGDRVQIEVKGADLVLKQLDFRLL